MMQQNVEPSNLTVANAPLPATYEAAKKALASCASIDECQDWANKAEAMASYARMADDDSLRKMADRIQARAVRRLGELLKQYDNRGGDQGEKAGAHLSAPSRTEAANAAGISEHQRKQAFRVSNVPQAEFDVAVEQSDPLTVTKLAEMGKQSQAPRQIDPNATLALGVLNKFADFCTKHNPLFVASAVSQPQVSKMRQKVGAIDAWLDQFVVDLRD